MDGFVLAAALAGLALNGWLLWQSLRGGSIAGCGSGPCEAVTSSRWAYLVGWPVAAFGLMVYTAILGSFIPVFARFRLPLLALLPGAAAWFVLVQVVVLKAFCPVCNAAHAVGLAGCVAGLVTSGGGSLGRAGFWAASAFLGVGLLQVYGPERVSHRVEEQSGAALIPGRLSFEGGEEIFDFETLPRLGGRDVEHVLVEFFDYQCAACRSMAGHIEGMLAAYPGRVGVLLVPVPLEAACNPFLGDAPAHPGSCEISRIALAVWRTSPAAFPAFHKSLLAAPSAGRARSLALDSMTEPELGRAMADPWIGATLRRSTAVWQRLSQRHAQLPKLVVRNRRVLHGLPGDAAEFLRLMRVELGL